MLNFFLILEGGQKVIQRWFCLHVGHVVWLFVTSTSFTHTFPSSFNLLGFFLLWLLFWVCFLIVCLFLLLLLVFFETGSHWVDLVDLKLKEIRYPVQLYIHIFLVSLPSFFLSFFNQLRAMWHIIACLPKSLVCLWIFSKFNNLPCMMCCVVLRIQLRAPCMVDKSFYCWAILPAFVVQLYNDYMKLLYMNSI